MVIRKERRVLKQEDIILGLPVIRDNQQTFNELIFRK